MNNLEIIELMRDQPNFIGVFPLDKIPIEITANTCFIFNTDTSNLPGTHWIAVAINTHNFASYYDPLAFSPITSVCNHLFRYVKTIYYIQNSEQSLDSNLCGQYCINFLKKYTF